MALRRFLSSPTGGLLGWLALVFAVAALGAASSFDAPVFYAGLVKPRWAPPAWVFGPTWSVLYPMMAVAVWRVSRGPGTHRRAIALFVAQLLANGLWSWLFFGWRLGALASVEVLVLLALIVATIVAFARIDRWAAWLMLPYVLWVTYASALTWAVWLANPNLL